MVDTGMLDKPIAVEEFVDTRFVEGKKAMTPWRCEARILRRDEVLRTLLGSRTFRPHPLQKGSCLGRASVELSRPREIVGGAGQISRHASR